MTERPAFTWSCTIPDVPPSFNEYVRMHWSRQQKIKREWEKWVWARANEKGNRCPRPLGEVTIRAVLVFDLSRRRDSDNFTATLAKFAQDGLVVAGVLEDDDAARVKFEPVKIVEGDEKLTVLTVEERAGAASPGPSSLP